MDLYQRESKMVYVRWTCLAAVMLLVQLPSVRSSFLVPTWAFYLILGMVATFNVIVALMLRKGCPVWLPVALLSADLSAITAGVFLSGGAGSPFVPLYLLPLLSTTKLFGLGGGLLLAALTVLLVATATTLFPAQTQLPLPAPWTLAFILPSLLLYVSWEFGVQRGRMVGYKRIHSSGQGPHPQNDQPPPLPKTPCTLSGGEYHPALSRLSPREREVLLLAVYGGTVKEIADHLGLSAGRIRNLLSSAYRKLGTRSLRETARLVQTDEGRTA